MGLSQATPGPAGEHQMFPSVVVILIAILPVFLELLFCPGDTPVHGDEIHLSELPWFMDPNISSNSSIEIAYKDIAS